MVALVKNLDADPQNPLRGRAQNRSDRFVAGPCSKPFADNNLRRVTYETRFQLESCAKDPIGFEAGSNCLYEYCHSKALKYIDPWGEQIMPIYPLDPSVHTPGLPHPPKGPGVFPLTTDEKKVLDACKGDKKCEKAVIELIEVLRGLRPPGHFNPKDIWDRLCMGGSCVVWKLRCQSAVIDAKACGKIQGIRCTPVMRYYTGRHPLWSEHHWVEFELPNEFIFYADDKTLGDCCDHIFFDYDPRIFPQTKPPKPPPILPGVPYPYPPISF
jgi:hypothetical protein